MTFESLQLAPQLLRALTACGYTAPTPIQQQTIPALLAGRDVIGSAQTGTGKTAAFVLPALQRLARSDQRGEAGPPRGQRTPRAGARAHARTRATGGDAGGAVRTASAPARRLHLRRCAVPGAESRARPRRRPARRHARPPDRPSRARSHRPVATRDARARRSRPHARHGLHRRRRAHRRAHAQDAADGAVLGDVRGGDRAASPRACCAIPCASKSRRTRSRRWRSTSACISPTITRTSIGLLDHLLADIDMTQSIVFIATKRDAESLAIRLRGRRPCGRRAARRHGSARARRVR